MKWNSKVRALIACFGLAAVFTTFSFRLVYLQVTKHSEYAVLAAEKHVNKQTIYARRGTVLDINGEVLAGNEPEKTVVADGALIGKPDALVDLLSKPLEIKRDELFEKLNTTRRYVVLKKKVSENIAAGLSDEMRKRSLKGVYFEQDSSRIYPNGPMLCHVIGFMNSEHQGVEGIENIMDSYLRGHDGFRFIERDRMGKELVPYRGLERPPHNGCNVRLTIDMSLQNIVENELDAAIRQFKPKGAIAIVMRPQTGEILALANRPNFDPNTIREIASQADAHKMMTNHAIEDMFEPGSTFKIVTTAAAINEKLVTPDTVINCESGHFTYCGRTLHDHNGGYGELTVSGVLMKSSNIGAAKLGLRLGDQKLWEYIRRFGFGERTGVNLPGEIGGVVHPVSRWSKISITHIPMGHEVGVTPIQTVCAMSAIANGGHLMMPQIVHDVTDCDGQTVASFPPVEVRQPVSRETAQEIRDALKTVVSKDGTAVKASVAGFDVAGKTGTAQKVDPKGGYMPGKYILSFCGFMPADKPEICAIVVIDEAAVSTEMNYGGQIAAPIFAKIAEKAARYLNLTPNFNNGLPAQIASAQSHREDE